MDIQDPPSFTQNRVSELRRDKGGNIPIAAT